MLSQQEFCNSPHSIAVRASACGLPIPEYYCLSAAAVFAAYLHPDFYVPFKLLRSQLYVIVKVSQPFYCLISLPLVVRAYIIIAHSKLFPVKPWHSCWNDRSLGGCSFISRASGLLGKFSRGCHCCNLIDHYLSVCEGCNNKNNKNNSSPFHVLHCFQLFFHSHLRNEI